MISPPAPLSSPELVFSAPSDDSRVAQVPTPRNGLPSPYSHQRALSETASLIRPRSAMGLGIQPLTEMLRPSALSQYHSHRPASPLGTGQYPVGGSHSHAHVLPHGHPTSTNSTPAQATFPHHPFGPHSPPQDHAGPSALRRHVSTSVARSLGTRSRAASGGHDKHLRCSPDCTAADVPYHLLSTVIGRASTNNFRKGVVRPTKRKAQDEDIEMEEESSVRPNLQTRRSRTRTSSYPGPASPAFPDPFFDLKPLAFDRKWLDCTPPLPPVDHMRDPPPGGDFFTDYNKHGYNATSNAILIHGQEPHFEFDIPRSSSAPAVPLLATRGRGLSDASVTSSASANVNPGGLAHHPVKHETGLPYVTSPQRLPLTRKDDNVPPSRFSAFGGRRLDPGDRLHSIGQLVGDPNELTSYLGEDLAAALKQRLQPEPTSGGRVTKRKEDFITEAEWSFDVPLSKALGQAVKGWVEATPPQESYHIVEYGCNKETPNVVLADTVRSLCVRGVGPGRPKTVVNVSHQCDADFDTRLLQANLSSDPASYRKVKSIPSPLVLTSFTLAGFTEAALPPGSIDIALCSGELSKLHGSLPPKPVYMFTSQAEEREQRAEKDLTSWLKVRSRELKPGGLLACTFAIRTSPVSEPERHAENASQPPRASPYNYSSSLPTSPRSSLDGHNTTPMTEINTTPFVPGPPLPSPPMTNGKARRYRPDIWQAMSHALSPAIQRLVSLGEIKTQVAPLLVDVPFWPRTLESIQSALSRSPDWEVLVNPTNQAAKGGEDMVRTISGESEVPLEEYDGDAYSRDEREEWGQAGVKIVRLSHPAWRAFREGKIDRSAYARRIATYCRSVYESHLKKVLREKGRMDISQCESTVQELFKVLVEKCELGALDALEIDVGIVVLKRT